MGFKSQNRCKGQSIRFKARVIARKFAEVQGIDEFSEGNHSDFESRGSSPWCREGISSWWSRGRNVYGATTTFLRFQRIQVLYVSWKIMSIYGFKQSFRMWHTNWHTYLIKITFKQLASKEKLDIRKDGNIFVILGVYVNDLLIASNSIEALYQATHQLQQGFLVKDNRRNIMKILNARM